MEIAAGQPGGTRHAEGGSGVRPGDLLRFLRQLQVKLKAGLSPDKALAALASETKDKRLRRACARVQAEVAGKHSLADALSGQAGIFDACIVRLVEEGETTGDLKPALAAAAEHVQRTSELRRNLQRAVSKPLDALLLVLLAVFIAAVALSFLVKDVLPTPSGVHHAILSMADRITIRAAGILRALWPAIGLGGAVVFTATHVLPQIPVARAGLDALARRLPLLGTALRRTSVACFAWTVGILLRAGVRLDEAMQVAAATANDQPMRLAIASTIRTIEAGKPYLDAMADAGLLRRRDIGAVSAAERRGELETAILALAADDQREADEQVARLRTVAQTTVVLVLGVVIVSVVLTLYVPVFIFTSS